MGWYCDMSNNIKVYFKHVEVYSEVEYVQCMFDNSEALEQEAIVEIAQYYIGEEANEVMLSIMLDTEMRLIGIHRFSIGGISTVLLPIGECFKSALVNKASYIFLAHVHPSGDCNPSSIDIYSTRNIMRAGELIGIPVLGHVIVTHNESNYEWIDIESVISSEKMEEIKSIHQSAQKNIGFEGLIQNGIELISWNK